MRCRILILLVSLTLPASDAASAGCTEDLTRIQLALPNAAPDIQSRISGLVSDALEKARTKDGAGCEAATASALQSLGLPRLAPIVLSTPTTQQTGSNAPGPAQSSQPTAVANNTAPTAPAQPPTGGSQAPPANRAGKFRSTGSSHRIGNPGKIRAGFRPGGWRHADEPVLRRKFRRDRPRCHQHQ
jgi:hypothetical protein